MFSHFFNSLTTFITLISPQHIIETLGLFGVTLVVFAESGLFFGFFLPGDTLLFTAGFLASQGFMSLTSLLIGVFVAAVVGDSVGYSFGRFVGKALYERPDSRWFKRAHLERAKAFYDTYGALAVILGRFIPIVRTFVPIVAGTVTMPYRRFLGCNLVGAFLWAVGLTLFGYIFGSVVPNAEKYVTPIVLAIIIISVAPGIYSWVRTYIMRQGKL